MLPLKKILFRGFNTLFNKKISASTEISVCYRFIVIYFQQNSVLEEISTFFFSLYCRNYCSFHLAHCDDMLLLHQRRSPSPISLYYHDQIKLKAGILILALKFTVSVPNLITILCTQSVSVILFGLIKVYFPYSPWQY